MRRAGALVLWLIPAVAAAQPADESATLLEARRHMEEGQTLYVQGRFVEAAQEFLRAYEIRAYSAFLYNAAVAYERFGHLGLAATHFERYLAEERDASDRAEVQARIARLRAGATGGGAGTGAGTGTGATPTRGEPSDIKSLISVQTNPVGCRVSIRDRAGTVVAEGTSPFHFSVDAGEYTVSSQHPDFRAATTDPVPVQPGKVYVVRVEMAQGAFLAYLRVVANVPGASVFVDEHDVGAVGRTPFSNAYPVGRHRIWVERPGYRPVESEVDLTFGEDVTLRVDLVRVDFGYLDLRTNVRGAAIFVDERRIGTSPIDHRLHAGRHVVRIEAEGYKTYEGRVEIARGQRTRVDVRLRPAPNRTGAYVSAGIAVVILGAAGYVGLQADSLYDDLDRERRQGRLANDDPRIMDGFLLSLGADIGFLAGAVVGGFAVYHFLRDPLPDSSAEGRRPIDLTLRPTLTPDVAGLAVGGAL